MEFMVVVILSFLLCICNGNGPSTQSSEKAEKKESRSIQSDINVLKDSMHELLKRVIKHENEISSLKSENQFLTNKIENERRQLSCDINVLHENTNEQQQALTDTNTEIIYLNETVEELRNGVDKLEELQRRRSEDNITECIDKPDIESNQERKNRDCRDIQRTAIRRWKVVIQKRFDGSVDFNQNWLECENGFGNINGEFWFVNQLNDHNGYMFSAKDQDNDTSGGHCAAHYQGPWWYYVCYSANLNIPFGKMFWIDTILRSVMMIRKI
ncbi:unnamed protein product [Mytilus edulis]|uniref:Fibrinogen C-terminal domain-containing protein n=1 Tax=Mytilus edulis TaxID=6550 RepID=A0A8S3U8Y0_MYTED|nr:unnamed protein product [Mytilus edulis]